MSATGDERATAVKGQVVLTHSVLTYNGNERKDTRRPQKASQPWRRRQEVRFRVFQRTTTGPLRTLRNTESVERAIPASKQSLWPAELLAFRRLFPQIRKRAPPLAFRLPWGAEPRSADVAVARRGQAQSCKMERNRLRGLGPGTAF